MAQYEYHNSGPFQPAAPPAGTDEQRKNLEAYIVDMRKKLEGVYAEFICATDAEKFQQDLTRVEGWLHDWTRQDAKLSEYIEKLDALNEVGEPVGWRCEEHRRRPGWIQAVEGTIANYRAAAAVPEQKYSHIAEEKLAKITEACNELSQWLKEARAKQEQLLPWQRPVLLCVDMEKKNEELRDTCDKILAGDRAHTHREAPWRVGTVRPVEKWGPRRMIEAEDGELLAYLNPDETLLIGQKVRFQSAPPEHKRGAYRAVNVSVR